MNLRRRRYGKITAEGCPSAKGKEEKVLWIMQVRKTKD